jgi:hypothetical protein
MEIRGSSNEQFGLEGESGRSGRYVLVPILIGLVAPVLVISILDPRALANSGALLHVYLLAIFVVALGVYIWSVLDPGDITRVTFDKASRKVIAERSGLFAKSATEIDFADIASIRFEAHYDDDGYQTSVPILVLSDRKTVQLPAGTTEADIAAMRALIRGG